MTHSLPPLSAAQTEIMGVIWEQGEATLAQICNALSNNRDLARNTVQTQLTRLVEKGWLTYSSSGKIFCYRATVPRVTAQSEVVHRVLDTVFGGSYEGLMMSLLDGRKLSREEADRIIGMILRAEESTEPEKEEDK